MESINGPQRFAVRHPRRYLRWFLPVFWAVSVIWVPLTWWGGNITDRSVGSAVFFFVLSFGALGAIGVVWARTARAIDDPGRNIVELANDGLTLTVVSAKTYRMRFADVVSAATVQQPYWRRILTRHPTSRHTIVAITRRGWDPTAWMTGLFGGKTLRIEPVELGPFVDALSERLSTYGVDTRALHQP